MTTVDNFPSALVTLSTTITSGQTASAAVDLKGTSLLGVQLPAAFTGTSLKFQVATTLAGTYQDVIDGAGNTLTKTVAQGKYLYLDPSLFAGIQFIKLVSGSSEGATRTLELVARPV